MPFDPTKPVLVVDLDGTLLRSDMLFESFWNACGSDWWTPLLSLVALLQGRAALKRYLADRGIIDVAELPYEPSVIAYVEAWRMQGGRTALVTACDERIARRIADHLSLFDDVHGSDGVRNLKGEAKADFLATRFGDVGYVYIGDADSDVAVWRKATKAITVNAPAALRRQLEAFGTQVEHLTTEPRRLAAYLKAARPHQWLKNLLVFLPMLAAHQFDEVTLVQSVLAFLSFSLIASSVYVLNDLLDLGADRAHPRKRHRPFASGAVPIAHGTVMVGGLLLAGLAVAIVLDLKFSLIIITYYFLTTAYSLSLKRQLILDICMLAGLYTLRIIAGGVATGIPISIWLLAFSMFFFLSLAAIKRHAELVDTAERGALAATGRGYTVGDIPIVSQMALGSGYISVLVMVLYLSSPAVTELYSEPDVLWGICLVLLYWISRMAMVAHRGAMHDDPIVYAVKDRISQLCALLILGFAAAGTWL